MLMEAVNDLLFFNEVAVVVVVGRESLRCDKGLKSQIVIDLSSEADTILVESRSTLLIEDANGPRVLMQCPL